MVNQRKETPFEAISSRSPSLDALALARLWDAELVGKILQIVWEAYSQLYIRELVHIDWTQDYEQIERSITQRLEQVMQKIKDPYLPVGIQHGSSEFASRHSAKAQPPEYDIAFYWMEDSSIMWPVEAKLLKNDGDTRENIGDYIDTLTNRFLTCRYAPYSPSGAMLSYLRSGNGETLLEGIATALGVELRDYGVFAERCHKISEHERIVPSNKQGIYPQHFICHHLVLALFSHP